MTQFEIAELRKDYLAAVERDKREWYHHRAGAARTATERKFDAWREASAARDRYIMARLDALEQTREERP